MEPCTPAYLPKAAFVVRVAHVKERVLAREKEVTGEWLTVERMKSKHGWSKQLGFKPPCPHCMSTYT